MQCFRARRESLIRPSISTHRAIVKSSMEQCSHSSERRSTMPKDRPTYNYKLSISFPSQRLPCNRFSQILLHLLIDRRRRSGVRQHCDTIAGALSLSIYIYTHRCPYLFMHVHSTDVLRRIGMDAHFVEVDLAVGLSHGEYKARSPFPDLPVPTAHMPIIRPAADRRRSTSVCARVPLDWSN